MTKAVWTGAVTAAAVLFLSSPVFAANDTKTVTVNVNVLAKARLDIGTGPIVFDDADPDSITVLTATAPFSVDAKVRTTASGAVSLTVSASDLANGSAVIPITDLHFAAGGGLTVAGNVSTGGTSAGSWTGSGRHQGTHTYTLPNSWGYLTGTYTTVLSYTLTTP